MDKKRSEDLTFFYVVQVRFFLNDFSKNGSKKPNFFLCKLFQQDGWENLQDVLANCVCDRESEQKEEFRGFQNLGV